MFYNKLIHGTFKFHDTSSIFVQLICELVENIKLNKKFILGNRHRDRIYCDRGNRCVRTISAVVKPYLGSKGRRIKVGDMGCYPCTDFLLRADYFHCFFTDCFTDYLCSAIGFG